MLAERPVVLKPRVVCALQSLAVCCVSARILVYNSCQHALRGERVGKSLTQADFSHERIWNQWSRGERRGEWGVCSVNTSLQTYSCSNTKLLLLGLLYLEEVVTLFIMKRLSCWQSKMKNESTWHLGILVVEELFRRQILSFLLRLPTGVVGFRVATELSPLSVRIWPRLGPKQHAAIWDKSKGRTTLEMIFPP